MDNSEKQRFANRVKELVRQGKSNSDIIEVLYREFPVLQRLAESIEIKE